MMLRSAALLLLFRAAQASRVALLLYGGFSGTSRTADDAARALIRPLTAAGHEVDVHIATSRVSRPQWVDWLARVGHPAASVSELSPPGPFNASHYAHDCNPMHVSETHDHYHEHSAHMEQAWRAVERYERERGVVYDFVIKSRCDLSFHPRQTLQACYLDSLDDRTLLSPDVEFFCAHRWNERGPGLGEGAWHCSGAGPVMPFARPTFPEWMPDLLFLGRRRPMAVALAIDSAPMLMPCWDRNYTGAPPDPALWKSIGNNERLMAEHVFSNNIAVYTVPLQLSREGYSKSFVEDDPQCAGHGGCWDTQPCRLCFACGVGRI